MCVSCPAAKSVAESVVVAPSASTGPLAASSAAAETPAGADEEGCYDVLHFNSYAEIRGATPGSESGRLSVVHKYMYFDFDGDEEYFPFSRQLLIASSIMIDYRNQVVVNGLSSEAVCENINSRLGKSSCGEPLIELVEPSIMLRCFDKFEREC